MDATYVIGLDFGTDSVRALLIDAHTGEEMATAVSLYPKWAAGHYCNPALSQYRQHPLDYLESLETCLQALLAQVTEHVRKRITGISVDTTGSTPVAVDRQGRALAELPQFRENPNAMFILWKDHTAKQEAARINELAKRWDTDYTQYAGGIYSPEWFWSKIWHTLLVDEEVGRAAYSWVEQCDWIPAQLTGQTDPLQLKRSRCAAGHKAMWHETFGGLPSAEFLNSLDPRLGDLRQRLYRHTYTADIPAGAIAPDWAAKLGLSPHVLIGTGALDAHMGAVGASISPYTLVKVMGTSTCDMLIAPNEKHGHQLIRGICGQVDGSIVPGMLGMEAGQSAFGDVYQWFVDLLTFPLREALPNRFSEEELKNFNTALLQSLNKEAATLPVHIHDELALDWINGRRTPDADMQVSGLISGLTLGTSAPRLFKALVEATAFGSRAIIERFEQENVPVREVIALGGISKKSSYVMQTMANIFKRPIKTLKSEQACALGAAMYASVFTGVYSSIAEAQKALSPGFDTLYHPLPEKAATYDQLYQKYLNIGAYISQISHTGS